MRYTEPIIKQHPGVCMICEIQGDRSLKQIEVHHVLFGFGKRKISTKYGLVCNLCRKHHREGPEAVHNCRSNRELLCMIFQEEFEKTHSHEEWMQIAGKNYR